MNSSNLRTTKAWTSRSPLLISVLSLDREERSSRNLYAHVGRAVERGSQLIVVPFGFPDLPEGKSRPFFSRLARKHHVHLVAGFETKKQRVAAVFSSEGKMLGTYAQTHRLPDEDFEAGDTLEPIVTSIGRLGLSIGSDIYFPEIHWSLVQQGADILVHLDIERSTNGHFYHVLSPKIRAFDIHRPLLMASSTSQLIKLVHNEEMEIAGVPMNGSAIFDQNGAVLASTGYSQGIATADLRLWQHCRSGEQRANMPVSKGLDVWKLYFNDSREVFFGALRRAYSPKPKPIYRKRKIRIAVLSHAYRNQLDKENKELFRLLKEACDQKPDIIVATEMEKGCRPDDRKIQNALNRMAKMASQAGSYLLVGGIRCNKPESRDHRSSHGWLWDRSGKRVFESAIMLYGKGCGQGCYDTDFGRIGVRLCGDVYAPELDRLFAMEDADIVFNPSMSWGASGLINTELNQVRAMDNGHFVVSAHLSFSDAGQRSHVIDPTGAVVAASAYYTNAVLIADVDLDSKRGLFIKEGSRETSGDTYLADYRSTTTHRLLSRHELLRLRRPELYAMIDKDHPAHPFTTHDRGDGCRL